MQLVLGQQVTYNLLLKRFMVYTAEGRVCSMRQLTGFS